MKTAKIAAYAPLRSMLLITKTTSDDPKELVALGPGKSFVIGGKATDVAGNNVGARQ